MYNIRNKKKSNGVNKMVKTLSFISFSLLIIRLGYLGKINPSFMGLLFLFLIVVIGMSRKFLYALLGIISFVLFIKLYSNNVQEE
ncbi:MAG: hypothetical protein KDC52_18690, partial [Ignavibacteriae bacterium]|nr:hypothetical protein [Ignavibacteriota bacterium]